MEKNEIECRDTIIGRLSRVLSLVISIKTRLVKGSGSRPAQQELIMALACPFIPRLARISSVRINVAHKSQQSWRGKQQILKIRSFQTSTFRLRTAQGGAPAKIRGQSKVFDSADEAVADIQSGSTVLSAGFGLCGTAETIVAAMARRGPESLHSLTAVSNNAGTAIGGGLSPLIASGQVTRAICSFLGNNKGLEKKYLTGQVAIELTPQGTLAEKLRCGGAGIPAFYTPTGVDTYIQSGQIPVRLNGSEVVEAGKARETRIFDGRVYNMETAIKGDVAIIRAHKVDEDGNCMFRYTTKSFAPLMAKAAKVAIVEAEHIVKTGELRPEDIDLPGIFIDRIVQATEDKIIEIKKLRTPAEGSESESGQNDGLVRRNRIARRAAKELKPGFYVNLGVGMPTLAPSFLPANSKVWIQSENGILGMGPYPTEEELDADIINAGKETVTLIPGASTFDSSESFGMIRGGHIDVSMLGALQVGANGDLANYMIPGKVFKGMGGAMDLVSNPDETKIVVLTDHVAKDGTPKIVQHCTLPLTGARCVSTIITDLCVFEVDRKKGFLTLTELAPGVEVDEIRQKTDAKFEIAENLGRME
nr:succinyl-coa:3-ketoacid coenzyme a transferase 1, mitochondrial [Quercus suber]